MFFNQSRRDMLRLLFGGSLLGACRSLFGVPVMSMAPRTAPHTPPLVSSPVDALNSAATYVYDCHGTVTTVDCRAGGETITTVVYDAYGHARKHTKRRPPGPDAGDSNGRSV